MGNRKSDKVDKVGGKTNYSFLGGVSPGNFVVSLYLFLYVKYSLETSHSFILFLSDRKSVV